MNDISFEKARDKAFRFLGYKARTYKEVYEKLREDGVSEEIIYEVMAFLLEYNYVNDKQYAQDYIRERSKKHGFYRIKHELKQRGISETVIRDAAAELDLDEYSAAVAQLGKRLNRFTGGSVFGENAEHDENIDDKEKRRCYDYLARRGFSHDTIKDAFREFSL